MTNCETCGNEVPQRRLGRRRTYCSAACRSAAYRQRSTFLRDLGRETIEDLTSGELAAAGVTPYDVAATAIRGGFGNTVLDELSPRMRAQVLRADAEYELEGRQQQAERKARGEDLRMRSIVAAVEAAQERGEAVSLIEELRTGGRNVGMTHRERVDYVSALMDVEDARREAAARRAFARFREGEGVEVGPGVVAADASAPTVQEISAVEAAAIEKRQFRTEARQIARHEIHLDQWRRGRRGQEDGRG